MTQIEFMGDGPGKQHKIRLHAFPSTRNYRNILTRIQIWCVEVCLLSVTRDYTVQFVTTSCIDKTAIMIHDAQPFGESQMSMSVLRTTDVCV